ncbi:MAG: aldo/keto reductase [Candidatus Thermoplasmatota archaeon]|nr:aldo/keto reductase [Candidatus Thermoplasmatota archaeon]MCL5791356.1 aldo/keto reductase [Candidatus Thermoplasmatota archaeon]
MERISFRRDGKQISPVGIGTYYDPSWIALAKTLKIRKGQDRKIASIKAALESGINLIDTAEMYETETIVSEAIKGSNRDDLFIATKVLPSHYSYDKVLRSCNRSLKRLGTEYIDLYQLHMQSSQDKINEALRAMEHLVDEGKIRHIGISNFDLEHTKNSVEHMKKYAISATQMNFNVAHRNIEKDIVPYCQDNNISILAYFPLSHGKLVSSTGRGKQIIDDISKNHGVKTLPQIILNWFISKYDFVFPIPRASNPEHVKENAGAMGWRMTPDEIRLLEDSVSDVKPATWFGDHTN